MLLICNRSAETTPIAIPATDTQIPFDTTVLATNGNLVLNSNDVNAVAEGVYESICEVSVINSSSSAAVTVTLTAYADGKAVTDATASQTIGASERATLILPWATKVVSSQTGTAKIAWHLSGGAVNLNGAIARISKVV